MKSHLLLVLFCWLFSFFAFTQKEVGGLIGHVVDKSNGELLIGVTLMVDSNLVGTVSDIDGNYIINNIPIGKHQIKVSYVGYKIYYQTIEIFKDQVERLDISLSNSQTEIKEVVIKSEIIKRDNAASIVIMQRNSSIIQSGISAEEIKKSPDRTTGEVIKRISGATLFDNKYVLVRGLSDRYNLATINGNLLPSTEPDRKTFAFDIFPAFILDNIIVLKTAQPDISAEWAGGLIQLNTRDIPEKNFIGFSVAQGFTMKSVFRPYYSYKGGTDFIGIDNGRQLPKNFPSSLDYLNINTNDEKVKLGQNIGSSWATERHAMAYPNQNWQLNGGISYKKKDIQVGSILALNYTNQQRFQESDRIFQNASKRIEYYYSDQRFTNTVNWAAILNTSVLIKQNHKLSLKNTLTVNSEDHTIFRQGVDSINDIYLKSQFLDFYSTRIVNSQLMVEHTFHISESSLKWNWSCSFTNIEKNQPASRRLTFTKNLKPENDDDTSFVVRIPTSVDPTSASLFYSKLKENSFNFNTAVQIPVFKIKGTQHFLKTGVFYQQKWRQFESRILGAIRESFLFTPDFLHIIHQGADSVLLPTNFGKGKLMLDQLSFPEDQYKATSKNAAVFFQFENTLSRRIRLIWGFRFEYFQQALSTPNEVKKDTLSDRFIFNYTTKTNNYFSGYNKFPLLPSLNLIVKISENSNFRLSYSQTLSRPEFRELAPFRYLDYIVNAEVTGNPDLLQTTIHNADIRYEYFMGRGQFLNVSAFYKNFVNPIEMTALPVTSLQGFTYNNAKRADNVGLELEIKKDFSFIHSKLQNLLFAANLAYIYSKIDLGNVKNNLADELKRSMQGQSPYVVNLSFNYQLQKIGFGATVLYNQMGHRLYSTGVVGNASWYEHWRPVLDFQISQRVFKNGTIRFTMNDLIAAPTLFYQNGGNTEQKAYQPNQDFVVRKVKNYQTFTISFGYQF